MAGETRDGDEKPYRAGPDAERLAQHAAHLRERADCFARSAAGDGARHEARDEALRLLVEELYAMADEVARIARDLDRR